MKFKTTTIVAVIIIFSFIFAGCKKQDNKTADKSSKNLKENASYVIGHNIGENMKKNYLDVNLDMVLKGMKDGLSGAKSKFSPEETQKIMNDIQVEMQKKSKEVADQNKKIGEDYLAKNKTKSGVKTLPSGLQYKVIKEGNGAIPKATDFVKTNYKGTLIDGTEFDSSYARNEPAVFPVNGVIKGWQEALQLMKVGSKWELYIPSDLGYGEGGTRGIPGNSVLIFEMELLSIEKAPAQPKF